MTDFETYTLTTTKPTTRKTAMGRTARHAVVSMIASYREGTIVTARASGFAPTQYRIVDGTAVEYRETQTPAPTPKARRTKPAKPAAVAPPPPPAPPALPATSGVKAWLMARGYRGALRTTVIRDLAATTNYSTPDELRRAFRLVA